MRFGVLAGLLCGIIISLIILSVLFRYMKTDGSKKCKYDERQQIARGNGFKYGFFTLLICNGIYLCLNAVVEKLYIDTVAAMFLIICLGVLVNVGYCIWHDAYMSLNENPRRVLGCFAAIGVCNLGIAGYEISREGLLENGVLGFRGINLMCGLFFIAIFCIMAAKSIYDRKEAE